MKSSNSRFERVIGSYFGGRPLDRRAYGVVLPIALLATTVAVVVVMNKLRGPAAAAGFAAGGVVLIVVHLVMWRDVMVRTYHWLTGRPLGDRARIGAWFLVFWSVVGLTLVFDGLLIVIGQGG